LPLKENYASELSAEGSGGKVGFWIPTRSLASWRRRNCAHSVNWLACVS